MMKLYEILLMGLVLVVCTSEMPHHSKPIATTYKSVVDPLDAYRIEYRCLKNDFDKKTQQAYISTSEIKEAVK